MPAFCPTASTAARPRDSHKNAFVCVDEAHWRSIMSVQREPDRPTSRSVYAVARVSLGRT